MTQPKTAAFCSAILFGVALSRALTTVSISRARAAGFEMLWAMSDNKVQVSRGRVVEILAELRNRDNLPTHYRNLHISHSDGLAITCEEMCGEIPANGSLQIKLLVRALRVGHHGLFNITLETVRAPGLFRVPLSFSNPFVVDVYPRAARTGLAAAAGGRAMASAPQARPGRRRGTGGEFRELREHRPGDPYRRIAWKASARRGQLLVIDREQEESDVVWLVVDASIDSARGEIGKSQLDGAIDETAALLKEHLGRGDEVGLALIGARSLAKILPGKGTRHAASIIDALTFKSHTAAADRSSWDEGDVARRVYDHACTLDANISKIRTFEYEKLALLTSKLAQRAPVRPDAPWSNSADDRALRKYLLSFGIQPPARESSDRHQTEGNIARFLSQMLGQKKRPSIVYLFGQPPTFETPPALLRIISRLKKHRIQLFFSPLIESKLLLDNVDSEPKMRAQRNHSRSTIQTEILSDSLNHRTKMAHDDGKKELIRRGAKIYPQAIGKNAPQGPRSR